VTGARAALEAARSAATLARSEPTEANRKAVLVALATVVRHDDVGAATSEQGYNPYRDKGGKFAPGIHRSARSADRAAAVERAGAQVAKTKDRVDKATEKHTAAKVAHAAAVTAARAAIGNARAAAEVARANPTAKNVNAARITTNKATRAEATVGKYEAAVTKHGAAVAKLTDAHVAAKAAHAEAKAAHAETPPVIWEKKKNPKRIEAAKKAAAASVERRREIHSAVASNLPHELQSTWDKEGHKFMQQEATRIRGEKDRINAASKISEAFVEQYGAGSETTRGYEGDRYHRRAEIEAKHAEAWADEQERKYYAAAMHAERHHQPANDDDVPF